MKPTTRPNKWISRLSNFLPPATCHIFQLHLSNFSDKNRQDEERVEFGELEYAHAETGLTKSLERVALERVVCNAENVRTFSINQHQQENESLRYEHRHCRTATVPRSRRSPGPSKKQPSLRQPRILFPPLVPAYDTAGTCTHPRGHSATPLSPIRNEQIDSYRLHLQSLRRRIGNARNSETISTRRNPLPPLPWARNCFLAMEGTRIIGCCRIVAGGKNAMPGRCDVFQALENERRNSIKAGVKIQQETRF